MYIYSRCLVRKGAIFYQQVASCNPEGQDPITVCRCLLACCPVSGLVSHFGPCAWYTLVQSAQLSTAADSWLFLYK